MLNISLIIPVYNNFKGIEKLISSIKNINEFKEIIIVDDDSDGQEIEKLTHYIRKYRNIKLVCNKENKGAGGARNTGMKESTGKWLLFSDSDDEFLPACYEQLCQYESCDSDIVFFPPTSRDEFGNIGNRHNVYVSYYNYYWQKDDECYLRYKLPVVWSRLFNRKFVVENNIIFDEVLSANDKMFSIKSGILARSITVASTEIYCWNYNNNSITTKPSKKKFANMIDVSRRTNQLLYKEISKKKYKKVATTISKLMALSLVRYKFGLCYNVSLLFYLIKWHFPWFTSDDLKKISNFFKNNKYYNN